MRQVWEDGQATSVEDLNTAMSQVVRRYTTAAEGDLDNPTPTTGQVRIITGYDLPTRIRPAADFKTQVYNGTGWVEAFL